VSEKVVSLKWLEEYCKKNKRSVGEIAEWAEVAWDKNFSVGKYIRVVDLLSAAKKQAERKRK